VEGVSLGGVLYIKITEMFADLRAQIHDPKDTQQVMLGRINDFSYALSSPRIMEMFPELCLATLDQSFQELKEVGFTLVSRRILYENGKENRYCWPCLKQSAF
jgi:hypothetical protein